MRGGPLQGVCVVDLTHYVAGPYCTKLFADMGADVIKIERPDGDGARRLQPFTDGAAHPEKSALFLYLNTCKRSVILDLKTAGGIRAVKELARKADILVENFRPGVMARLGIDYGRLERLNPGLVMTSISNFGQDGPYRDWAATDLTLNALSGMMLMTGEADREPVKLGLAQVQYTAGVAAAIATLAAHRYQRMTGYGQHVDVSVLEPFFNMLHQQIGRYGYMGVQLARGAKFPWLFPTKDGWVHISPLQMPAEVAFLSQTIPEFRDPRFSDPGRLAERQEEFAAIAAPWFLERTSMEATHEMQMQGINSSPSYTEADLLGSPQLQAREYFDELEHPVAGRGVYPGRYFFCDEIPKVKPRPAPLLGQHTEEVLGGLERAWSAQGEELAKTAERTKRHPGTMPLAGIRILSVEHWAALPHATKYLASLGAEVIVVEGPGRLRADPKLRASEQSGGLYVESHRNKLGITIDLSKQEGIDLFKQVVRISDVVVDNFTPRVMKNFGLDYKSLRQVKPNIITLSISGYGRKGPWNRYRGYSLTAEATSGLGNLTGYPDGPPVRPGGTPFGDMIPALHAAWTLLVALEHRERTGEGAEIDVSMVEPCTSQLGEAVVHFSHTGRGSVRMGNRDANSAPSGCYPCRGEDSWVTIATTNDRQWQRLVEVLGDPAWADGERFGSLRSRLEHQDEIDGYIADWTRARNKMDVMKLCQKAGVPAGAVLHISEIFMDEQNVHRRSFEVVRLPPPPKAAGTRLHLGPPWKLSKTISSTIRPPRIELGEDNDYVFRDLLGLESDGLSELEARGVISRIPTAPPPDMSKAAPRQFGAREEKYLEILGLQ